VLDISIIAHFSSQSSLCTSFQLLFFHCIAIHTYCSIKLKILPAVGRNESVNYHTAYTAMTEDTATSKSFLTGEAVYV